MEAGADARLTLLSAPAGFGKTSLLAAWLHDEAASDRSVAWLSLDATDNDPTSFWTTWRPRWTGRSRASVTRALAALAAPPAPTESVPTRLLNDLATAPGAVWLVLDDYHLIDSHKINQTVALLLERLPAQAHVVISTRADPDLALARWRARGELLEIRATDLRFTSAEATAYLTAATGRDLATADIAALEERTEGWIAALQLAALSLEGREDASGFIARFAGDDRYIVAYLIEEVLWHQTDAVRRHPVLSVFYGSMLMASGDLDAVEPRLDDAERALASVPDGAELPWRPPTSGRCHPPDRQDVLRG